MQRYPFPYPNPAYTWNAEAFTKLLETAGLSMTFDITHLAQVGEDITEFYRKNKERVINIHLSDFKKSWLNTNIHFPDHMHLSLGQGELPIEEFLKTLKKENYKGLITMEINSNLEGLCKSANLIKKVIL